MSKIEEIKEIKENYSHYWKNREKASRERESFMRAYLIARERDSLREQERERECVQQCERERER